MQRVLEASVTRATKASDWAFGTASAAANDAGFRPTEGWQGTDFAYDGSLVSLLTYLIHVLSVDSPPGDKLAQKWSGVLVDTVAQVCVCCLLSCVMVR